MEIPSDEVILKELRVIAPRMEKSATFKELKAKLSEALGLESVQEFSEKVKRLYQKVSLEIKSGEYVSSSSSEEEPVPKKRKRDSKPKDGQKSKIAHSSPLTDAIASLKALGRAMGTGPTLYKGIKDMTEQEQMKVLRSRLKERGATFSGDVPTQAEIKSAARKRAKKVEMDGIDTSLIITNGRRRQAARAPVYPSSTSEDDSDNSSTSSKASSHVSSEAKRSKTADKSLSVESEEEEEFVDDDDDDEAEFEE